MPVPTPFHPRTFELCRSLRWKDWAGYYAVSSYESCHEPEYMALRHSAGLIDVSPLFKYEITGPDAARFLSRLTVRDVTRLSQGRVSYLCWCDDAGKVIDDGTVSRLGEHHYRLTAAEPSLAWFDRFVRGYEVEIEDSTDRIGTLSLQGPRSRDILSEVTDTDMETLRFFGTRGCQLGGQEVLISRTGYTGDLGYEIWVDRENALAVYDALLEAGRAYGMLPVGLDAMDVTRIEAGFVMNGVDYYSAHHCLTEQRKSSPFELGLGWTVKLDRDPFVGQRALLEEKRTGPARCTVGLDIDWAELESLFDGYGLPPELPSTAWRDGRPIYDLDGEWVGQATSGSWSPILKKNLALALVPAELSEPGTKLKIEATAEYRRHSITATVSPTPFYDPPRKRA